MLFRSSRKLNQLLRLNFEDVKNISADFLAKVKSVLNRMKAVIKAKDTLLRNLIYYLAVEKSV